jgi:hypothetical protein
VVVLKYDPTGNCIGEALYRLQRIRGGSLFGANTWPSWINIERKSTYGPAGAFFEEAIRKSPRHYQIAQDNLTELRGRRAPALLAEE